MRKITFLLAAVVTMTMAACGSGSATNQKTDSTSVSTDTTVKATDSTVSVPKTDSTVK